MRKMAWFIITVLVVAGTFGSLLYLSSRRSQDKELVERVVFTAIKNVRKSAHGSLPAPTRPVDHRRI